MTRPSPTPDRPSGGTAPRWLHVASAVALALPIAACSADSRRLSLPAGDPGICRPGTFIGDMTINCPQPAR